MVGTALAAASLLVVSPALAKRPNSVDKMSVRTEQNQTLILLDGARKPAFSVFKLEHPARLVIDLANTEFRQVPAFTEVNTAGVRQVAVERFAGNQQRGPIARLMVGLVPGAKYNVRATGKQLQVIVEHPPASPASASPKATAAKLDLAKRDVGLVSSPAKTVSKLRAKAVRAVSITDVRFLDLADRVIVEVDADGKLALDPAESWSSGAGVHGQLLTIRNAQLPLRLQRKLDTSAFAGPVKGVISQRHGEGDVQLRVELRGEPLAELKPSGERLRWTFHKPERVAERSSNIANYEGSKVSPAGRARASKRSRAYSGQRIDLDFKDADIHNILRLLADVGRVNIVTSDVVSGKVTIRMKDVPWDQALDVILRAKGLGMVREGNLLRVAPIADLEKEREAELARKKQLMLLQPMETRLIALSYAQAADVLPKLRYTLSPRGKLTFDDRTNMIIARDIRANLDLVEQMVRNLDSQTPQVLIEARIVEARTNFTKQVGIQWGGSFTASSANGNSTGLVFPNQIGIGGGNDDAQAPTGGILLGQSANPNFIVNMPAISGQNAGAALGLTLGSLSGAFNVNLRLSAAETSGDIRIISSPKITTLDNVEAKIEQGVTIPFSQVSANGVQTTFKDAKLNLTVKPHVTADGSVIMKVNVQRNEPDFVNTGPRGEPTILKKEASTEMLVKDGQTAVIGGIYTTRDGRSWSKVPWLADIPVLGWLFKSKRDTSDREEVLVFITPRIVNRAQSIGR
ncbi:MAG: type IV pilus secretin PilQ [Deltaproteobacteria bacterium]|nr:type IV pilus secretin PilQ [Deltaproteobacteria bacterium]